MTPAGSQKGGVVAAAPQQQQQPLQQQASLSRAEAAKQHILAVTRDYRVAPRLDYRTVAGAEGPLVVFDDVKFPKYYEIVTLHLGDGSVREGQVSCCCSSCCCCC